MVRYFAYFDLTLRVQADVASHLEWLTEFLHPFFEVSETGQVSDVTVVLHQDTRRFESLFDRGPLDNERKMDAFALDNSVIALPEWDDGEGWLTLYEEKFRTFFRVRPDRREVHLVAEDNARFRIPLMRVLREFAMNHLMQKGGVFLHASGVAFGENGLLFVGTKNAGKTSLLTHFLRHTPARYVSNDRMHLALEASPVVMRGMPTLATIRSSMLPLFPGLDRQLDSCTFHHYYTLQECAGRSRPLRPWKDGRYGLTPAQFLNIHNAVPAAQALPRAILFPRVTHGAGTMQAIAMPSKEVALRFPEALLGVRTWRNHANVFNVSGTALPSLEELLDRCKRLAMGLPCFEVQLGTEAYTSPRATDHFLSQVLNYE